MITMLIAFGISPVSIMLFKNIEHEGKGKGEGEGEGEGVALKLSNNQYLVGYW
jgi:hypothetical protein